MKVLRDVQRRSFHCSEDENTSLRRGRRQKLTDRQLRLIIRTVHGQFTARRIMKEMNI